MNKYDFEAQRTGELAKSNLSEREFNEWQNASHTFLIPCQYNKFFVIYEDNKQSGEVKILETFRVSAVDCSTQDGLGILIESSTKDTQWVECSPTKLFGYPIYANVPIKAEVRFDYKPNSNQRILTTGLIFRVVSSLFNPKEKGPFLSDLSRFRATYEEYKGLVL